MIYINLQPSDRGRGGTHDPQHAHEIDFVRHGATSRNAAERCSYRQNQCIPGLLPPRSDCQDDSHNCRVQANAIASAAGAARDPTSSARASASGLRCWSLIASTRAGSVCPWCTRGTAVWRAGSYAPAKLSSMRVGGRGERIGRRCLGGGAAGQREQRQHDAASLRLGDVEKPLCDGQIRHSR